MLRTVSMSPAWIAEMSRSATAKTSASVVDMAGMLCRAMPTWSLLRRDAERIAVLTFTRPPRNFMSFASMTELEPMLEAVAADETVNVVVLTGGLPGYFIAHA